MHHSRNVKHLLLCSSLLVCQAAFGQGMKSSYTDSINRYIKNYVATHEVVRGDDRKHLHFFKADSSYRVTASFEKINDQTGFSMATSQRSKQEYYRYGKLNFLVNGAPCTLTVYQSKDLMQREEFKNYLFVPFTDASNGTETYEGGRYIDLSTSDISGNKVVLDFNKAYNPYCCYTDGYSCPVPPKENALGVAIRAGEMKYSKPVH